MGAWAPSFANRSLPRGLGLVLVDRNAEKSKRFAGQLNGQHPGIVKATYAVDLASHHDIKRLTGELLSSFPQIDFLFNNAGVLTETLQFSQHSNEMHFEVNTLAPLQLIDQLRTRAEGCCRGDRRQHLGGDFARRQGVRMGAACQT